MTNAAVHLEGQQHSLHTHAHDALASGATHTKGQQHPIKLYLVVWGWLFVLSTCSYLVDYFGLHGYLRSSLSSCTWPGSGWPWPTPSCSRRCWCWYSWRSWCSNPTTRISSGSYFSRQRRSYREDSRMRSLVLVLGAGIFAIVPGY